MGTNPLTWAEYSDWCEEKGYKTSANGFILWIQQKKSLPEIFRRDGGSIGWWVCLSDGQSAGQGEGMGCFNGKPKRNTPFDMTEALRLKGSKQGSHASKTLSKSRE